MIKVRYCRLCARENTLFHSQLGLEMPFVKWLDTSHNLSFFSKNRALMAACKPKQLKSIGHTLRCLLVKLVRAPS